MSLTRREAIVAIGTLAQAASSIAAPDVRWPTKAVRTVLPSGPGGGSDVVLRLINSKLQPLWQQPVVVDYRPGANSILATDAVAKAAPDGYTIGMALTAYTINPALYPDLPYNPRDLIGLSQVASADFGLFANPSLEPSTVPELIAYAKKNPNKLSYATSGVGSGSHLAWEMFNMMAGTHMVHVPYSKGGGAAQLDVIAGRIPLLMDVAFGSMNMVQQGKLKLIAFASPTRSASHPEVPLISETLPGFSILSNMGMIAPAAMPRELVERISADIVRAVHSPDIKGRFADLGLDPVGSSADEYNRVLHAEMDKWAKVIKTAGIKLTA